MSERMIRAEQVKEEGAFGKKGWLIVTNERLVFSSKNELGKGERWSTAIRSIDSAAAKKPFRLATDILEVLYRDQKGKRQRKVFERISVASFSLLGSAGRLETNALAGLEHTINAARESIHEAPPAVLGDPPSGQEVAALERLADLKERGALTDDEFAAAKRNLLGL